MLRLWAKPADHVRQARHSDELQELLRSQLLQERAPPALDGSGFAPERLSGVRYERRFDRIEFRPGEISENLLGLFFVRLGTALLIAKPLFGSVVAVWLCLIADYACKAMLLSWRFARGHWKQIAI